MSSKAIAVSHEARRKRAGCFPVALRQGSDGRPQERNTARHPSLSVHQNQEVKMARAGLLWLLGVPIPILLLMWVLGWLH
jgi:hypothetical protein